MVAPALAASSQLDATVVNMRFVKPLDESLILRMARTHKLLVTVEENALPGGAGSAVAEVLAREGLATQIIRLGLPDRFLEHAERDEQLAACGLDSAGILRAIRAALPERAVAPARESA
jgi:1-deoxy-D-xylulose-5-phosphate synthase